MRQLLLTIALCLVWVPTQAGEAKKPHRVESIDYGGAFAGSFALQPTGTYDKSNGVYSCDSVPKGVLVMFGEEGGVEMEDGAIFDLDSQRVACLWTGGAPRLMGWWLDGTHGEASKLRKEPQFVTSGVGWENPAGGFDDPRTAYPPMISRPGPLPSTWSRTAGYYRCGRETVFSYKIGDTDVLECLSLYRAPVVAGKERAVALARTFTLAAHALPLTVVLADAAPEFSHQNKMVISGSVKATVTFGADIAQISHRDQRVVVQLSPAAEPRTVTVLIAGRGTSSEELTELAKQVPQAKSLREKIKSPSVLWPTLLVTSGKLGENDRGYAVDAITLPDDNPWAAWIRPSAIDFFNDGKAALATLNGDVFVVSGLDAELRAVTWKRYAAGLYSPLGLKIVNGIIHVACRDGIIRLHDADQNGEADYYELLGQDLLQTHSSNGYLCDLDLDPQGNFMFCVGGSVRVGGRGFQLMTPHQGTIQRMSPDGKKLETYATGLRMANGFSVRADGQVTVGDNEGTWVPATPIHWVKPGDFLGVCDTAFGKEIHPPKPLCFLPQTIDNSACSQTWVSSNLWGPFTNELIHLSYGKAGAYLVYRQEIDGLMQGGVIRFPARFSSAAMRSRFNPIDGQMYVVGLGIGQTTASKPGGFDRVRLSGKPVVMGRSVTVLPHGLRLTFTAPLEPEIANDVGSYSMHGWNYRWTNEYGSKWYSISEPDKITTGDVFHITSVKLSQDRLSVDLTIPDLKPSHQYEVKAKVTTATAEIMTTDFIGTIHRIPKP